MPGFGVFVVDFGHTDMDYLGLSWGDIALRKELILRHVDLN